MIVKCTLILLGLIYLTSFNLFGEDCVTSAKNSNVKEIVKVYDYLGEETNKFKEYKACELAFNESCVSKWGTLLDKSCFHNVNNKSDYDKVWNNFDDIILKVHTQGNQCAEYIGFKRDIHSVLPIIRRAHVKCFSNNQTEWMNAETTKYDPSISITNYVRASFDGSFTININQKEFSKYDNNENANALFHEVTHFLKINNRSTDIHNNTKLLKGCSSKLVVDAVYIIMAACFPLSKNGKFFYENNMHECKNECINTLTHNYNSAKFDQAGDSHSAFFKTIGQQSSLVPYKVDEAKLICNNIYQIKNSIEKYKPEVKFLEKKIDKITEFSVKFEIKKINNLLWNLAAGQSSLVQTEADFLKFQNQILASAKKYCVSVSNSNSLICDKDNFAIKEIIKSHRQLLKNLSEEKFLKLSK